MKKAFVYIDGFNLYYRAVKNTPYKWLNLRHMCEVLFPEYQIDKIKYFTAPVSGKEDPGKNERQQRYWRALRTIGCDVILGKFLTHEKYMRLAEDLTQSVIIVKHQASMDLSHTVLVSKTEEKGSDVNLAAHLLIDGYTKSYEAAIILTNDSDLLMPVQHVRDVLNLETAVINPDPNSTGKALAKVATTVRQLRSGVLKTCQFPNVIHYSKGVIKKPEDW